MRIVDSQVHLAIAAATTHPYRFAITGRFDPDAPNARDLILKALVKAGVLKPE